MVVVMLTLLMIQLQSFSRLILVFLTAPLGIVGASLGLNVASQPFGFVALLGLIALAGMIMRNAVILVDQIRQDIEAGPGTMVALTPPDASPGQARLATGLTLPDGSPVDKVIAYRVLLSAEVFHDTLLSERHVGLPSDESLGCPLLRAVHLLEPTVSSLDFHSLHEIEAAGAQARLLDPPKFTRMIASLDVPATLNRKERMQIRVRKDAFKRAEAWLDGEVRLRPPLVDTDPG